MTNKTDDPFDTRTFVIVNQLEYHKLFTNMDIRVADVTRIALEKGYIVPKEQVGEA